MQAELNKHKTSLMLFLSCWIAYFIIVISRTNYSTAIAFIVNEGVFSKSDAGIISAAFYFTYGFSQLFFGKLADKISPYKLIALGILGALLSNFFLLFFNNFWSVLFLWSFNGITQFGVWPGMNKIIAAYLLPQHGTKASLYVPLAVGCGNITSMCVASSALGVLGWKCAFLINVVILTIAFLVWIFSMIKSEKVLTPQKIEKIGYVEKKGNFLQLFLSSGLIFVVIISVAQGMLDTGIKSWVPTMLMESYNLTPNLGNVIGGVLNLINVFGVLLLSYFICRLRNLVLIEVLCFLICLPACAFMMLLGKIHIVFILIAIVVATTTMCSIMGFNLRVSSTFNNYGYTGTVCGIINSCSSLGIVIANSTVGNVAQNFGWSKVALLWSCVALFAIAVGAPAISIWKKFTKK